MSIKNRTGSYPLSSIQKESLGPFMLKVKQKATYIVIYINDTIIGLKEMIMVRMTTKDKQQLAERAAEKRLPLST